MFSQGVNLFTWGQGISGPMSLSGGGYLGQGILGVGYSAGQGIQEGRVSGGIPYLREPQKWAVRILLECFTCSLGFQNTASQILFLADSDTRRDFARPWDYPLSFTVIFHRNWDDYSGGFGRLSGEFWLGLENIHLLTDQKDYELKVELVGWNNKYYTSYYDNFHVQVSSGLMDQF